MDKIENNISTSLSQLNISYDKLDLKTKEYLVKIEDYFQAVFQRQETLNTQFKDNMPSLSKVSKSIKIARQTLYNNDILKIYAEKRISDYKKHDSVTTISELREQIALLNDIINKMSIRDVNIELYKHKIEGLETEIRNLNKECEELRHRLIHIHSDS